MAPNVMRLGHEETLTVGILGQSGPVNITVSIFTAVKLINQNKINLSPNVQHFRN